jgi:VanZ family protein
MGGPFMFSGMACAARPKRRREVISTSTLLFLRRLACSSYWLLLTVLLLAPNPLALFHIHHLPAAASNDKLVHFSCFLVLAILVGASHFPVRVWMIAAIMVAYAVIAEAAQYFSPPRTVDAWDAVCNLAGLATGTVIYELIHRTIGQFRPARSKPIPRGPKS